MAPPSPSNGVAIRKAVREMVSFKDGLHSCVGWESPAMWTEGNSGASSLL